MFQGFLRGHISISIHSRGGGQEVHIIILKEKFLLIYSCQDQSKELRQFNIYKMHSNFNLDF